MLLRRALKRVALVVLGALAFAQAGIALAACTMDRGGMAQMSDDCDGCKSAVPNPNLCVAHCTSDLQQAGLSLGVAPAAVDAPALLVSPIEPAWSRNRGLDSSPPGAPPRRILLHSFLI